MPSEIKQKSPSRKRKTSAGRRSRSRTRKTNQYLLIGREQSVSQTRLAAVATVKTNGHISRVDGHKPNGIKSQPSHQAPQQPPDQPLRQKPQQPLQQEPPQQPKTNSPTCTVSTTIQLDMISLLLFGAAFTIRIWNIRYPDSIIFDEQILGSQISSYYREEMYFSLDPPLVTQFYSLIAYICGGWNEEFDFTEVGKLYPTDIPYISLRITTVLVDSLLSPLVYQLMRSSGANIRSSILPALLVTVDPAMIVQSRIYTGDGLVITLSMISLYSAMQYTEHSSPVHNAAGWLTAAGISTALALSMKYSALLTGTLTLYIIISKFWKDLANIHYTQAMLWRNLVLVWSAMILLPLCVYMVSWTLHVCALHKAASRSTGATQLSLSSALKLTELHLAPRPVTNGSTVTLKHLHGKSCWLHSHNLLYPKRYTDGRGSSHQQQITCYPYVDQNNRWSVIKSAADLDSPVLDDIIRHGDLVFLVHTATGRILNSHLVAAPLSSNKQEVSCYIDHNISMNVEPGWVVDIENRMEDTDTWFGRISEVKLIHANTSAALSITSKQLPDWAMGQYELVADTFTFHENTLWVADEVTPPQHTSANLTSGSQNVTMMSAMQKVYELHKRIFLSTYEYSEDHEFSSSPLEWTTAQSNLIYWVHPTNSSQIHMLPNIPAWLLSFSSMLVLALVYIIHNVRVRRGITSTDLGKPYALGQHSLIGLGGYCLNYVPYFLTDQVLLLYSYIPALIFAYISLGFLFNHLTKSVKSWCGTILLNTLLLLLLTSCLLFSAWLSPLVYGSVPQYPLVHQLKSLVNWRFLHDHT